MARFDLAQVPISNSVNGRGIPNATVTIKNEDGTNATVYTTHNGSVTVANPQVTNFQGRLNGWVEEGYYRLLITANNYQSEESWLQAVTGDVIVAPGPPGPQGPQGVPGNANFFIGPDAPVNPPTTYVWFETELGDGTDFTMWVEDGS